MLLYRTSFMFHYITVVIYVIISDKLAAKQNSDLGSQMFCLLLVTSRGLASHFHPHLQEGGGI